MHLHGRIRRKLLREALPLIFRIQPTELLRLGSFYGGWYVPVARLNPLSICYSCGVGEDITFDLALTNSVGCQVHLFDPTPRAKQHFSILKEAARGDKAALEELPSTYTDCQLAGLSNLEYHEFGIWSEDTQLQFFPPQDPMHVSHSVVNIHDTKGGFFAPVRSIGSIAKMLGHDRIDLLKMDIEGAEMAVIRNLISDGPLPNCLCAEFDSVAAGGLSNLLELKGLVRSLREVGYQICSIENWNFVFVLDEKRPQLP